MSSPKVSDEGHSYVISEPYKDPDFPSLYRTFLVKDTIACEEFILTCLYYIFQKEKFQGKTFLEFGCGPTVHRLASPSRVFSEITQCEFSEHNREQLKKWLKADPSAQDWGRLLRITARHEEFGDLEQGVKEIEKRIRSKVKKTIPCDILQKQPIPPEVGQVDCVFTSYCLEGACPTPEAYKSAVNKLGKHVRPGGALVMVVILDMPFFCMKGDNRFCKWDVLPVTQQMVNDAIKDAGFTKKDLFFMENNEGETAAGVFSGVVVVSAIKE